MIYDLIIIGGGPAGLTAALYGARAGLTTLVLEKKPINGGQITSTSVVENWPGTKSISGMDLANSMAEHVLSLGVEIKNMYEVQEVKLEGKIKKIKTNYGEFESKTVIIATGCSEKKIGVKGEEELKGQGVSYCSICDAPFTKGKTVAVIGGGNSALEEAEYLSTFASKVYLIHRREEFRADKVVIDKVKSNKKIEFLLNKTVSEIIGKNKVEKIRIKDTKSEKESELKIDFVFVFIGMDPNTELFKEVKKDQNNYILADKECSINLKGVFVAGDVRSGAIKQVVVASSDGATAALSVRNFIKH